MTIIHDLKRIVRDWVWHAARESSFPEYRPFRRASACSPSTERRRKLVRINLAPQTKFTDWLFHC